MAFDPDHAMLMPGAVASSVSPCPVGFEPGGSGEAQRVLTVLRRFTSR